MHCCSQCSFTSQFQSALLMHRQLHHGTQADEFLDEPDTPKNVADKSDTVPRSFDLSFGSRREGIRLGARTTSATRLFDKLRARICRTKTLLSHPEENSIDVNNLSASSECTSKAFRSDSAVSKPIAVTLKGEQKETYGCHLCTFEADRITVLDRHLLNDHNIGLENLLKLVMAKTKDGVSEEAAADMEASVRPYYKAEAEGEIDGEFIIKTVTPTVKILKHAATNTEIQWNDIPDLKKNCRMISHELEKLINHPVDNDDEMLAKMQNLNECMCKFMDSSKTLTRVLTDQYDGSTVSNNRQLNEDMFDLELGSRPSPRDWERPHSEQIVKSKKKFGLMRRGNKTKFASESFYF